MVRVIKGFAALLALIITIVVVPAFLVIFVGNPFPAAFDWSDMVATLTRPDDGGLLLGLVTITAWVAWATFAGAVVVELVAVFSRQRFYLRVPGLGVQQRFASSLVIAVLALAVAAPQSGHAEPARSVTLGPERAEVVTTQPAAHEAQVGPRVIRSAMPPVHTPAGVEDGGAVHTVQRGDDLWTLAVRYYGEGRDWRKIAAANPEVLTGGPDRLEPGWRLIVPDVASEPPRSHVVQAGDTLSSVAAEKLGSTDRWPEVFSANRFQLDDADELAVGLRLVIPTEAHTSRESAPGASGDERPKPSRAGETHEMTEQPPPTRDVRADQQGGTDADALPKPTGSSPSTSSRSSSGTDVGPRENPSGQSDAQPTLSPLDTVPAAQVADPVVAGMAGAGGLLAASVLAGTLVRRRRQLQARPLGRRIAEPPPAARLVETHLGARQQPIGLRTLDLAIRAIAAHCHSSGDPLPVVETATVTDAGLTLQLGEPIPTGLSVPDAFDGVGVHRHLPAGNVERLRSTPGLADAVRPYPALVTLGSIAGGGQVVADLETLRLTSVESADEALAESVLTATAVELSCSPWAEELELVLVGACAELPAALGQHNVTYADELGPLLDRLARRAAAQRGQRVDGSVAAHRVDPDLADPWVPTILVINAVLSPTEQRRLRQLVLAEPPVSIAAIGRDLDTAPCRIEVARVDGQPVAHVEPYDLVVRPQLLDRFAAEAVIDLIEVAGRSDTTPAPWWFDESAAEPDPPDNVTYLGRRFGGWSRAASHMEDDQEGATVDRQIGITATTSASHPVLHLLGPVELDGAAGTPPSRAARQCLEYCAWLLERPGTSPAEMATALAVAEGTRRSNMSRLRAWLGADELDQPYLPDAYSGRITLHPSVSSDWQRLQILTSRGVNLTSSSGLEAALKLVRGAPLADAAPGQWYWAEGLRTDMLSAIRDIGVELADRALADSDIELARWAASRALLVAPGDELLLVARIKTEHLAGNHPEVERLTLQLAAHARALEVDLRPETVDVLQEMMEGRVRARLA